ncbi:MAG TPA: flagellar basal body P-ring protein FlgI [Bryobacteraceae bacterium]|nr:flagellar basal body P-ring protein FlgI [Bryobacteraceae bacterium]
MKALELALGCWFAAGVLPVHAARLKDLVDIEGVRDNQLVGYGLVVGLAGTGDGQQTTFPAQSVANMLERMGVSVPSTAFQIKNTAAVMVTATLPPFAQPGMHIDITVGAMGDARNLQGGILVLTSLRGADGQVYAVAQGPVVTGGFGLGRSGNTKVVNHPTVGLAPNGAIVERAAPSVAPRTVVRLQLRQEDFITASRIVEAVNRKFQPAAARAENPGLISVAIPKDYTARPTEFVAFLEDLEVEPDRPARVIINERTGTIVLGKDVRISPVAILHGNLSVEIQTSYAVSQPAPLSPAGTTQVVPQTNAAAKEEVARNVVLKQGATVEELVRALAAIGSTPRDVIAILQNLHEAGALEAAIEVM